LHFSRGGFQTPRGIAVDSWSATTSPQASIDTTGRFNRRITAGRMASRKTEGVLAMVIRVDRKFEDVDTGMAWSTGD